MSYLGDIALEKTFDTKFTTVAATGAPTVLAGSPVVSAYLDNNTTQLTAGITLTVDFDGVVGLNNVRVVATAANGYAAGVNYQLVITTGTVGGVSVVGYVVAEFSIQARSALRPLTADRTLVVDAAGLADANTVKLGPTGAGTAQTARDIGASVLLSTGTGTGQLDFTSGVVKANLVQILATALTETAGLLAGGFKKFFNVATPTGTVNSLPDAVAGAAGGVFIAGTNAATSITTALTANVTGNITGNLSGSAGSVTGAVGSVTGNVGGNVTGSVGSLAAQAKADVNTEVDTAIADARLDELLAADSDIDGAAPPTVGSVFHELLTKTTGSFTYDQTTDSLEAVRDRGDAAWVTGGGGSITDLLNVTPLIPISIDLANTATWRLGLMLTNALDDLPTTAEITPGTISIDRKAIGGTSWTAVETDTACSESAGLVYFDEVFDTGTGYAEGDSIRVTFKSQKITVAANDYEVTDSTGRIFYTEVRQTERGTNSAATATALATAQVDLDDIQARLPATLVGGRIDANVGAISSDAVAADNAEAFFDGTGYAGTNNVIPLVTTVTNVTTVNGLAAGVITPAAIATDAIDSDALAANAITEIQNGLATSAALTTLTNYVDTEIGTLQTDVSSILADTGTDGVVVATTSKTGYALSAAGVDEIFDELRAGHSVAGSYGESFFTLESGAAIAGTLSTTQMSTNLTEATDDHLNGRIVIFCHWGAYPPSLGYNCLQWHYKSNHNDCAHRSAHGGG